MNKKTMSVTKTVGTMMALGGAAAMIGSAMMNSNSTKRQMKKTAGKAMKTINGVLDGIQSMM